MNYSITQSGLYALIRGVIVAYLFLSISGCKKDDEKEPEPEINAEIIEGNIDNPRILTNVNSLGNSYYCFTGRTDINAELSIEPGVIVLFKKEADLYIKGNGTLKAIGNETDKIIFRGEQDMKGYWGGLYFHSDHEGNNLQHCIIENAGNKDRSTPARTAAVIVHNDSRLTMQNTVISKSGGYGIFLYEKAGLPDFNNNTIKESSTAPAIAALESIAFFGSSNNFQGNANDHVDTYNSYNNLTGDHVWSRLNVPYRLPGKRIDIEGNIQVKAGTVFITTPTCALRIQPGASFAAEGSAGEPVVFRGQEAKNGFWGGFQFVSDSEQNVLRHIVLEHAGGSNTFASPDRKAGIEVSGTGRLVIANSRISYCNGAAIRVLKNGYLTETDNTFSDNEINQVVSQ